MGKTDMNSQERISLVCREIEALLLEKNRKYGDSALNPLRIFSRASTEEQINVRIDDKLSRMARFDAGQEDEDVELDLIGYLILKRVYRGRMAAIAEAVAETASPIQNLKSVWEAQRTPTNKRSCATCRHQGTGLNNVPCSGCDAEFSKWERFL